MRKTSYLTLILSLQILFVQVSYATLTVTTTNANCASNGSITLSSNNGNVSSFSYSGANSGVVIGNTSNLSAGIYNVTATLSSGNTEMLSNVIVDHTDHIQLKNWYMTGNIPSASVNWGATIDDPLMTNWTGLNTNNNGCVTVIYLNYSNIIGTIPNFNLPNLQVLYLGNNQLTGIVPNFNLPNLQELYLGSNQLNGTIPNFNLPNLQELYLDFNQFTGNIPTFNLPSLKIIRLSYNQLIGNIPVFNLPNLQELYLNNNQLTGNIPILNLPKLQLLYLNNNQLTGNIPTFSLPDLYGLYLNNNQLTGNIPTFNLPNLAALILSNNQLTGTIPNFNFTYLRYIYLSNNQLTGNIPNFNLPNLQALLLSYNQLSGCIPYEIKINCPMITSTGGNIGNNPSLLVQSWSDYWNNNSGACQVLSYSSTIASCGTNPTITLSLNYGTIASYSYNGTASGNGTGNSLNVPTGTYDVTVTTNNGQIITLNNVIAENSDHIQLKNWYLTGNIPSNSVNWGATLNDPLMVSWSNVVKNTNGCITAINLDNKNISGSIPNFKLPNLTTLYLQGNQLSGCIPYEIKTNCPLITSTGGNIGNNPSLLVQSWVDYWNNSNGACQNLSYSSTIASCGTNPTITLSLNYGTIASFSYNGTASGNGTGNSLNVPTGTYSVTVTTNNGQIITLNNVIAENSNHVQLKNWYLTGNIPSNSVNWEATLEDPLMTGWTGITTNINGCAININLCCINITGLIPNFNLPSLENLNLSYNQLTGNIPNFNLPNLVGLNLSYNQLNGSLPNLSLPNLQFLELFNNYLVGSLPNLNIPNLKYFNLSNNQMNGNLPNLNLPNLQELDLSSNQFNGNLPNFNLPSLETLRLNHNQLIGNIPNFNLPNLKNLYLNNNQLTGSIPNFTLPNLSFLYLNNNQLTGSIPNFTLPNLSFLYLNNNQLTGSIPNFTLPNLSFLYLNNNQLTGSIPNFNWLVFLNDLQLHNNQLSGCIPLQIKFNSPSIGMWGGNISGNPNLSTQSWADYWNSSIGSCPAVVLKAKVFLQNVNNNLMSSYLSSLNTFPQTDPYSVSPLNAIFTHINNPTVAKIVPIALTLTGNNKIVDWVFLELRTGISGSSTVAYTTTALLQADGDITSMNGRTSVLFENAIPNNYYIAIRHRNHLGFRTANSVALSKTATTLNFTNNSIPLYGAYPTVTIGQNQFAMCSGDANSDGSIDAFDTIDWEIQNGLFDDYTLNSDYNMDGSVDAFDSIFWELNNGKFQELE